MRCRLGGWLHDIGKLAIPDRVLQASADSEEARAILRTHVELGADIVAALRRWAVRPPPSATTTSGTTARAIPTRWRATRSRSTTRIVAAADAWSAIRAGRAYQEALDPARALRAAPASAGASLDPAVVAALAAVVTRRRPRHILPARSSCSGGASFRSCVTVTAR